MSDRNEVDEIVGEARRFGAAMMAAITRHSQAGNWLERRKARKEISRILRAEQRDQAQARKDELTATNHAVDRYRAHSKAVAARAADPNVDHRRRAYDAQALARHRDDLAGQFVANQHLTRTEQGIALDGLDAATVFPEYKTGDLFGRAHKVKGLEALRYRALVARETRDTRQRAETEHTAYQQNIDATRRANLERAEVDRIEAAQPNQHRYTGEISWVHADGVSSEWRSFPTERAATGWIARNIDHTLWPQGTTVAVETLDRETGGTLYSDHGEPGLVGDQITAREAVLRERTLAGYVHYEQILSGQPDRHNTEQRSTAAGSPRSSDTESATSHGAADRGEDVAARIDELVGQLDGQAEQIKQLTEFAQGLAAERDSLKEQLINVHSDPRLIDHDELVAELHKMRGERDEAVQKLVERTPRAQRYGSVERQAEQSEPVAQQDSGASALADYQPGRTLADAVARNGHDREGVDR